MHSEYVKPYFKNKVIVFLRKFILNILQNKNECRLQCSINIIHTYNVISLTLKNFY